MNIWNCRAIFCLYPCNCCLKRTSGPGAQVYQTPVNVPGGSLIILFKQLTLTVYGEGQLDPIYVNDDNKKEVPGGPGAQVYPTPVNVPGGSLTISFKQLP